MEKVYIIDCINKEIVATISLEQWKEFFLVPENIIPWRKKYICSYHYQSCIDELPEDCFGWNMWKEEQISEFHKFMINVELHKEVLK